MGNDALKQWLITTEELLARQVVVWGENEEDALEAYESGDWYEDLGYSDVGEEDDVVMSVEEWNE